MVTPSVPGINPLSIALDAPIPSSYRNYTRSELVRVQLVPPLDNFSGPARAIVRAGIVNSSKRLGRRLNICNTAW
jgi:hypothetical protein